MRIGVISDIHGNWHALAAVLERLELESLDAIWCLGDLVGYGPRPNDCCAAVAEAATLCICGNHDLVVLGAIDLAEFSYEAAISARWTQTVLSEESRSFLERLRPSRTVDKPSAGLYHGSPRDPVWEYVLSEESARGAFVATSDELILVGHSHVPLAVSLDGDSLEGELAPHGTEVDLAHPRWLLNPGSVGQPRDGDPRAAFLLLDFGKARARFERVEYDVEATQLEVRERSLPESLAARLAAGV